MKKLIPILFMIIMLTGCGMITPETPFFGGFVDTTPKDLAAIHNDVMERMTAVPGTMPFELKIMPDGKIAGYVQSDGFSGWCSNYASAINAELLKAGYPQDQIEYVYCSLFDTKNPDHVVVLLNEQLIFDSNKMFVMEMKDYPKKWSFGDEGFAGVMTAEVPYIWWAYIDNEWVVVVN